MAPERGIQTERQRFSQDCIQCKYKYKNTTTVSVRLLSTVAVNFPIPGCMIRKILAGGGGGGLPGSAVVQAVVHGGSSRCSICQKWEFHLRRQMKRSSASEYLPQTPSCRRICKVYCSLSQINPGENPVIGAFALTFSMDNIRG